MTLPSVRRDAAAPAAAPQALYEALFHRNAFGICFGEGEQLTAANDAFLALLGWTRAEFDAAPPTWRTIVPGAGSTDDEAANREAVETGTWVPMERTWPRRGGEDVPVLIGGTVYDRERFRWVAYVFDISRQRETERALARAQERLALAVRGSSDGIWDWDLARDQVFLSPRTAEIIGHGPEESLRPGVAMYALLHPSDLAEWRRRIGAHFRTRVPYRQELRVRRPDGSWQWVRVRGEATFVNGRAIRMAGTVTDIRARKEAELRLAESERRHALALRATSDGIFEFIQGQDHLWCSPRTAEILELDEFPQGGMVPWSRAVAGQAPEDVARQQAAQRESFASGVPYDVTMARTRLDGSTQWLRVRAFPDLEADGGEVRLVGSISDITADVAARQALRASEARVWQAQKMDALGTMASGIAHDFNNLISVILGYVEVGLSVHPEGLPDRALREIGVAGRRARDLVAQILSFSRRHVPASPGSDSASVPEAIRETRQFLAATPEPGVTVVEDVADDLDRVAMDPGALQQVLLNLAMNAMHAMRAGGGTLTLGAAAFASRSVVEAGTAVLPAGRYVRLTVRDTGVGIPHELLDRVFEPFFTTKAQGEGTGLGLAVVHGLVLSAGGAVQLASTVGQGTTVDLTLPVVGAPPDSTDAAR